jgi:hypothetical protein
MTLPIWQAAAGQAGTAATFPAQREPDGLIAPVAEKGKCLSIGRINKPSLRLAIP